MTRSPTDDAAVDLSLLCVTTIMIPNLLVVLHTIYSDCVIMCNPHSHMNLCLVTAILLAHTCSVKSLKAFAEAFGWLDCGLRDDA